MQMHPSKFSVRLHRRDGNWIYRKKVKNVLLVLQAFLAAVLAWSFLTFAFWTEDSCSLSELSKSYEQSDLFFRQVDTILKNKISAQENRELFEQDGQYNAEKEIDIQSYGSTGNTVKDMNTTYLLSDLLTFSENGGLAALKAAVQKASAIENRQEAGELLDGQSDTLETIRPVTGITLSECSRWYSDSASFVFNTYVRLAQVCEDIAARYQQYMDGEQSLWSENAPSNLRYCIENTATGDLYSNFGAESYDAGAEILQERPEYTMLYEGERSYNIMVANQDHVLNAEAEAWFLNDRFVGTNEKVLLAIDQSYPVNDELRTYADYFANRETIIWVSVAGVGISGVLLLLCFVLSLVGAGLEEGRLAPRIYAVDKVPTELAAGIYAVLVMLIVIFLNWKWHSPEDMFEPERAAWALFAAGLWLLFLSACMGFMRRLRSHKLWHNSICRMLLYTWKQVTSTRAASGQLLFFYIMVIVLNFLFLLLFKRSGIFPVLVIDMIVLLFLLRDMAGKQSVWEGIHQISKGDLTYKIDTTTLTGESYEMAQAVNEMGDGLQEAVEAIIKNERLKAELITNVSHDLKTPLTSIVNYVDLLKRENLQGEKVQHYIEVLDQKSQRLKQLTEDLVEVSKISSGNVELHMTILQVQAMLDQAYGEFEDRFEEKGLTPVWNLPAEPVMIEADGRQFWRVLENLFGNLCKYAKENSSFSVTVKTEAEQVIITVANTAKEALHVSAEELMGRFVRGDRSRNTEGSGLGLSIAKSLTELQGGGFSLRVSEDRFAAIITFPQKEKPQKPEL